MQTSRYINECIPSRILRDRLHGLCYGDDWDFAGLQLVPPYLQGQVGLGRRSGFCKNILRDRRRQSRLLCSLHALSELRKNLDIDNVERELPGAADAMGVGLPAGLAKTGGAGLDVLPFGPLPAVGLGLCFVTADGNADVIVAVRVEERSFAGREQDVENADVLVLKDEMVMRFLFNGNGPRQRGGCARRLGNG